MKNNAGKTGFTRRDICAFAATGSLAALLEGGTDMVSANAATSAVKLPRVAPDAVGISSQAIAAFVDAVEQKVGGLHSFMLLRHGKVAAEAWWAPYGPAHPHMLYSLSKSFTSTAVGLAISEGKFTLDSPVLSFFPGSAPANPSANLQAMQVRHLLEMGTGHDKDATGGTTSAPDGDWVKAFLSLPVEHAPGTHFAYNSAATYMLSAIVQITTGKTALEFLTPRLFEPLGITGMTWETCPKGINTGGWGLAVKTEDIARFGQLYLQKGKWQDRQLIPEAWVEQATTKKISNGDPNQPSDWSQGYCYQFWRCRHEAYRGDGACGQYCVVFPQKDAVLAITSGVNDMQAVLNAVWDHLLPGMDMKGKDAALNHKLARLEVAAPTGKATSASAAHAAGRIYRFDANDLKLVSAAFHFHGDTCEVDMKTETDSLVLSSGYKKWEAGSGRLPGILSGKTAGRGAWTSDDVYEMKLAYYETPYIQTLKFRFTADTVALTSTMNVAFGVKSHGEITGRSS